MASVITNILGGGALEGVAKIINAIKGKNPEDAAKLQELLTKHEEVILQTELEQRKLEVATLTAQTDINKVEAASGNWFVAAWRPAVGWVCVAALFSEFIVRPFVVFGASIWSKTTTYPTLDMGDLMTLLLGLLGLAGARTFEKIKGVSGGH